MDFLRELLARRWIEGLLVILLSWFIGLFARRVIFNRLAKFARRTRWRGDEVIIQAVRPWIIPWAIMVGLYLALRAWGLSQAFLDFADKLLLALAILSVTLVIAKISVNAFKLSAEKIEKAMPVTSLTQNMIRIVILCIGVLILFNGLGISITPIITALGIGGLAVALALQDTLSNLFAGLHITLAKQVKVGDYIKLESGEEGYVTDIGWRNVTIKMLSNNIVIVPNSKLAQSIIINYHFADQKVRLSIPVGVSYESDPEVVEKVLVDETKKAVGEVKGLVGEEEPYVIFMPGFGDFSLDFTLFCYVRDFADLYPVQHQLRKRIFKRFKQEGIEIPFPIRTIRMEGQEGTSR